MSEISVLEDKWEGQLNEVVDIIYEVDVFSGGMWFQSQMEYVDCGKAHTSGTVPMVTQHSQLSPICYKVDSINSVVAARRDPCGQGTEDEGEIHRHIGV